MTCAIIVDKGYTFIEGLRFSPNFPYSCCCITDCATLQPLSTIAPHIMEQIFFLQRYSCFKERDDLNELWLYISVITINCILRSDFSTC